MLTIIPHVPQVNATYKMTNQDCGIACVSMVLQGIGTRNSTLQEISQFYPVDSTWTIDLAYILRKYGVEDFTMYTSHIGVNWDHSQNQFYKRCFQQDLKRIHHLFAISQESQVRVCHASLDMDDLRRFLLSNRYAVIMLVNLTTLVCPLCREKKRKEWYRSLFFRKPAQPKLDTIEEDTKLNTPITSETSIGSSHNSLPRKSSCPTLGSPVRQPQMNFPSPSKKSPRLSSGSMNSLVNAKTPLIPKKPKKTCLGFCTSVSKIGYEYVTLSEFQGHFIVLIGYDRQNDMFFYRDPGTDSELCAIGGDELEECFYVKETDRDAIVVRVL